MYEIFDPQHHLRIQLGFLQRSCELYDQGHREEGIRIATVIRTLMKDGKPGRGRQSVSLIGHLEVAGHSSPRLLACGVRMDPRAACQSSGLSHCDHFERDERFYTHNVPNFDLFPGERRWLLRGDWWADGAYVMASQTITRGDLVLAAAEQDGGAHVDSALEPIYQQIARGLWSFPGEGNNHSPVPSGHLADLRHMGYELLASPDLRRMADR